MTNEALTVVEEPLEQTPATQIPEENWDDIPLSSASDFFGNNPQEEESTDTNSVETQTPNPTPAPAAETDDDFWGDTPAPAAPAASKPLRSWIAETFGVQVGETDTDEAIIEALSNRLKAPAAKEDPIKVIETTLALDDKGIVRRQMLDDLAKGVSEFETEDEIDDELERLAEVGALGKKATVERRRLEAQKTEAQAKFQQQADEQQQEIERQRQEFQQTMESFQFEGIPLPKSQVPVLQNYIESQQYINQVAKGIKPDGTQMTSEEMIEQVIFANPTFRKKYIERIKAEERKKVVSDTQKKLENRGVPAETGGYVAPSSGERTLGHKEYFAK